MARKRKNRSSASVRWTPPLAGTPPPALPRRAPLRGFGGLPRMVRLTRPPASPSVRLKTPVRPYLMRTVFTDTTLHRNRSSQRVRRTLQRRPSPDVPNRALARSNPWNTYLDRAWPVLSDQIPLQRATICARRQIRREVLLALGRGNGSGSRGIPKSKVRCS